MRPRVRYWLNVALTSLALVAVVSAVIALLEPEVPALGLGVLYLLAVVPIAVRHGAIAAGVVSVASVAAFSWFFVPPRHSLNPGTSERWSVLAAFLLSSLVVSTLAARSQREARRSARLAEEQAALRRVATLVAHAVPPSDVFAAVTREVGLLLGVDWTHMARYEHDGGSVGVGGWSAAGDDMPVGTRVELDGDSVGGQVKRTGRPARLHDFRVATGAAADLGRARGLRSAVGAPVVVDQELWGVLIVATKGERLLPADTESRIAAFTELVATAIANTENRTALARLAEEQAALRRVATLVAHGAPPDELFAAVIEEVGRVLPVSSVALARYEGDGMMTAVATSSNVADRFPAGSRWALEGHNVSTLVAATGRPARVDNFAGSPGDLSAAIREQGLRSSIGAPIVVEGKTWGMITGSSTRDEPLPADTEARLASFTSLVATAISNTEARTELAASRARIVAAADEERRRVVRDLHDGAQQRLVHTIVTLKMAEQAFQNEHEAEVHALVTEALDNAEQATSELRELTHGILPTVLTKGGLSQAIDAMASRTPVPVEIDVSVGRLPTPVERTAYFVVAEALTNVAKHAGAAHAEVTAACTDGSVRVEVRDDGVGGAKRDGSGLVGLADRLAAVAGELRVESPSDGGTRITATIPLPRQSKRG